MDNEPQQPLDQEEAVSQGQPTEQLPVTPQPPITPQPTVPELSVPTVSPAATIPQPAKPKRKRLLVLAIVLLVIMPITLFATTTKGLLNCALFGKSQLSHRVPDLEKELASISFVSHPISQQTETSFYGGDCVDSAPDVDIRRTISVADKAGAVFNQINTSLTENGYHAVKDRYAESLGPCAGDYREYTYVKSDHIIEVSLTCSQDVGNSQLWKDIPVTTVRATLKAGYYPTGQYYSS